MITDINDFLAPHTLFDELQSRVHETPDKVFLWFDDVPMTFSAAEAETRSAANQLLALGVEPGDTVAILTASCREWVSTWIACTLIGAISMPINSMFRGEFLRHQLADANAKVLLLDAAFHPNVAAIASGVPSLRTILLRGKPVDGAPAIDGADLRSADFLSGGDRDEVHGAHPIAWNEPACLFYTSGTTGPSKGALLTQQYLCVAAKVLAKSYGLRPDDVVYAAVPLFHLGGAYGVVAGALVQGRTAVLDSAFSVSATWDRIRTYNASVFLGVGPMIMMLAAQPADEREANLPIRLVVAAPVPAPLHEALEARWGCTIAQAYGQTEVIPVALTQVGAGNAPGSAGQVGPLHDVRIVDDSDHDVESGAVGEIVVRPRYPHVMFEGYRNQPQATLDQMRNLWYHTGDLGRIDKAGNLWWIDRKKDAIRRRGENISSFELEMQVVRHPAVVECAAHAVPSNLGEDDVMVCVVLSPESATTAEHIFEYCVETLPSFMVPRYVEILDSLPKNAVGRVQKHVLRARGVGENVWKRPDQAHTQ